MKLFRVPVSMYKRFFVVLLCVFVGVLVLEFVASMLGNPIVDITVNDKEIVPETPLECLLTAAITSVFISGAVNFFLTVRIIKEVFGLSYWPAGLVVFMTLTFPLELLARALLAVPNIIIFGLKSRDKNRIYKVEF